MEGGEREREKKNYRESLLFYGPFFFSPPSFTYLCNIYIYMYMQCIYVSVVTCSSSRTK